MIRSRSRCSLLAWLALAGICFPTNAVAVGNHDQTENQAATAQWRVIDVELRSGGVFIGQVLDAGMRPVAEADVAILSGDDVVASCRTDQHGRFAAAGLRGGVHQIHTRGAAQVCRLWAPGTAPPDSPTAVQIVSGADVIRGQWGPPPGNGMLKKAKVWATNPFVIGGIVAAAVAIPVALHNADEDDDGPAS